MGADEAKRSGSEIDLGIGAGYPPSRAEEQTQIKHDAVFGEMDKDSGPDYRSVRPGNFWSNAKLTADRMGNVWRDHDQNDDGSRRPLHPVSVRHARYDTRYHMSPRNRGDHYLGGSPDPKFQDQPSVRVRRRRRRAYDAWKNRA